MINFFRKTRKRLADDNKFFKYSRYAIGEIVLVVIGILIALSINNWNEERIANNQIISFCQSIKEDLKIDTLIFTRRIEILNEVTNLKKMLLSLSDFKNVSTDSLFALVAEYDENANIKTTTFDKIKSLGLTQISKNESLSIALDDYYTTNSVKLASHISWGNDFSRNSRNYWFFDQDEFELNLNRFGFKDSTEILQFKDKISNRQNLIKLISAPKGRNYIKVGLASKQVLLEEFLKLKELATELIVKIEDELK